MQGRVPVGVGTATGAAGATAKTIAVTGGEETHSLTIPEMPAHVHSTPWDTGISGVVLGVLENITFEGRTAIEYNGSTAGGDGINIGSVTPHNNMQPYLVLNYIIKF
jgi:microcystin-dependent protein